MFQVFTQPHHPAISRPTSNLRLFIAAYPPIESSRAMLRALESLPLDSIRITPAAQVHLTLQFVGDVPSRELDAITESVERSAAGLASFTLTPRRLLTLPVYAHPRLIAAETDSPPALLEIQRRLALRLASNIRPKPADRFLPHITLCRFNPGPRPQPVDLPLDFPPFTVTEIVLMRSTLSASGAEHHEVMRVSLVKP